MEEANHVAPFPLVARSAKDRVGMRGVVYGLAQYVYFLPDSPEKQRCFRTLDRLLDQVDQGKYVCQASQLTELLEAFGGFMLALSSVQPEKDTIKQQLISWYNRLSIHLQGSEERAQEEPHEPLLLPLVASEYTPEIREGLWDVIYGLAQYINYLPDIPPYQKHRELCFKALDGLVRRYLAGSVADLTLVEHEIGELLHAFGGFLLTLYYLHSSCQKDRLRPFITDWCARIKEQVERT